MKKNVFDEIIKNETFDEKIEYEKAHTQRMIVQNQKDAAEAVLNTTKKIISQ
jgi:hypothetical protein